MKPLCASALLLASLLSAQNPPPVSFDDLSARALSEVDSNPAEAVSLFQKALDMRPSWPEGWLYMASDLYALQRYAEARDAFRKGIAVAPQNGTEYGFLGLAEYALGDFNQALIDIGKGEALGLGPNIQFETVVRVHAALVLIRAQAYDEALAQVGPLAGKNVNTPELIQAIGLCELTLGRTPETLSARERAVVDLVGKAAWANRNRMSTEATEGFRELMAKYPDDPGVHYAYGVYQMELDQHVALAEFEKELKANPEHWPSMLVVAFLKTRNGEPEAAIESARKAMRLGPARDRWISQTAIGQAYLSMGEPEKAMPELEAAVKQQPSNDSIHFLLEQAYRLSGRKEDAKREKDEYVRLKEQQDPLMVTSPPGMSGEGATDSAR
jgi:tetratricopeptide (TPR) repeat protein